MVNSYPEIHFLKTIVKKGDFCIDIGANLGYYSTILSRIAGERGHVYAVEPIPLFNEIWKRNTKLSGYDNLTLLPYALGEKEGMVKMGTPERNGVLHHGMTRIVSSADDNYIKYYDVEMKRPDELFSGLQKVDFIKCDVEGYESHVFLNLVNTIKIWKPLIQTELSGEENRKAVYDLLRNLGYSTFILENEKLKEINEESTKNIDQDFYFMIKNQ